MAQRAASYGAAVLHKSLTMKHCFRLHFITPRQAAKAPQYEASPFHSDMKHFAYAPYDLSSIVLRATDDEKMKNESLSVCNTTLSALYYDLQSSPLWLDFLCLDFTQRTTGIYSKSLPQQRFQEKICRNFKILSDITENLLYL